MADLLWAVALFLLVVTGIAASCVALAVRAVFRANRVSRRHKSAAPITWLVSLGGPARLHRRLRRAVATAELAANAVAPAALPLRDVAAELTSRAIAADQWLVTARALHPEAQRFRMTELAHEVREIEVSAARLHGLAFEWRRSIDNAVASLPAPDLHQRLDAVEAALRELPNSRVANPARLRG
ncbi:MAG TPA: hypothetical protein VHT30_12025 [Acidimicrobiales bacterium]|nr:hypothetical protein [Acidimicrobiales bacterium]